MRNQYYIIKNGISSTGNYFNVTSAYLLDKYPAVFTISNRKLSSQSTKCMRIRRDSDNMEIDIGFRNGFIDSDTISQFVGSSNGYVVIKYNQGYGGSVYDAVQSSAANQPRIVVNGILEINPETGLVDELYSGAQWLNVNQLAIDYRVLSNRTSYVLSNFTGVHDSISFGFGSSNHSNPLQVYDRRYERAILRGPNISFLNSDLRRYTGSELFTFELGLNKQSFYKDGINTESYTAILPVRDMATDNGAVGALGRMNSAQIIWRGYISEIVFREGTDNVDNINENITNYYGI